MVLALLTEHEYFKSVSYCFELFISWINATLEEIKYGVEITDLKRSQKPQKLIQWKWAERS